MKPIHCVAVAGKPAAIVVIRKPQALAAGSDCTIVVEPYLRNTPAFKTARREPRSPGCSLPTAPVRVVG